MFLKFNPLYGNGLFFAEGESVDGSPDKGDTHTETESDVKDQSESKDQSEVKDQSPSSKGHEEAEVETLGANDKSNVENHGNSFESNKGNSGISGVGQDGSVTENRTKEENAEVGQIQQIVPKLKMSHCLK